MKKVLITGGSGMIGIYLTEKFINNGYQVHWLSRKKLNVTTKNVKTFQWDLNRNYIDLKALENAEYVVNLAGAGIADKRWTAAYKRELYDSRIKSSELLVQSIIENNIPVRKFIGASAVGYYGLKTSEKIYSETDEAGDDFLAELCKDWEGSYKKLLDKNINTAIVRIGLVLSHTGGLYKRLKPMFQSGLGSALGSGRQYMPWIHIDDLCKMIIFLTENEKCTGIFNAVSGEYICNYEFSKQLACSLNAPFFLPAVPGLILKLVFGEQYNMLVKGLKISNKKIKKCGFDFEFKNVCDAFNDLKLKDKNGN